MTDRIETSFVRTWQLLALAKLRSRVRVLFALTFLFGGWLIWLVFGRVPIYASSQRTWFEAELLPRPIQSPVDGTVVECNLSLAQHVRDGEVLVRLNARTFELQLDEANANLSAALADIGSLEMEIAAQERAREALSALVNDSSRAGRAKVAVSRTNAKFTAEEGAVLHNLGEKELASKLDQLHAEATSAVNRAQVAATSALAAQETGERRATLLDRDVQISALEKSLVDARLLVDVLRAHVQSLQFEIDRRQVRANGGGTLADIVPCTPGMSVTTDRRLAVLLPDSKIRVVSLFKPEDAVGRIKAGQSATLRVDNFPWTQFGTVAGVVNSVGSEPSDGVVRVELGVTGVNPSIPIVHGLTGLAEVQVEKVSPLQLLLRTIGEQLKPRRVPVTPVAADAPRASN